MLPRIAHLFVPFAILQFAHLSTAQQTCPAYGNQQTLALALGPGADTYENLALDHPVQKFSGGRIKFGECETTEDGTRIPDYMEFNNKGDRSVNLGNAETLGIYGGSFTASAWIYHTGGTGDESIFGSEGGGTRKELHLILRNKRVYIGFYSHDYGTSYVVPDNKWTYVTFRYDHTGATGWQCGSMNGQPFQCGGSQGAFNDQNDDIILGNWRGSGDGNAFSGKIAYPSITKDVLSETEVQNRMKMDPGCFHPKNFNLAWNVVPDWVVTRNLWRFYNLESDQSGHYYQKSSGAQKVTLPNNKLEPGSLMEFQEPAIVFGRSNDRGKRTAEWANEVLAGKLFTVYPNRNDPQQLTIYALEDAAVTFKNRGTVEAANSKSLNKGEQYIVTGNYRKKKLEISSTGMILVKYEAKNADLMQLAPATNVQYGMCSNACHLTIAGSAAGKIKEECSNGETKTLDVPANDRKDLSGTGSLYSGRACKYTGLNGALINGYSFADSNGGDSTSYLDKNTFYEEAPIPTKLKWLTIMSAEKAKCTVNGGSEITLEGSGPYQKRTTDSNYKAQGKWIKCDKPVMMIADEDGTDDEFWLAASAALDNTYTACTEPPTMSPTSVSDWLTKTHDVAEANADNIEANADNIEANADNIEVLKNEILGVNGAHYWPLEGDAKEIFGAWNGDVKSGVNFDGASNFGVNTNTQVATFDGSSNSYIELPDIKHGSGAYSICGWAKQDGMNNWQRIVDFGRGAGDNNILVANEGTSRNMIWEVHSTGSTVQRCKSDNFWTSNVWTHFCVTMAEDTSKKIYKNGALVQSCDNTNQDAGLPETTRSKAYIGKSNWGNDALFKGQMAQLLVLDGTEVDASDAQGIFENNPLSHFGAKVGNTIALTKGLKEIVDDNTADIASNSDSITSLQTLVNVNTANVASNTLNIDSNSGYIAGNTENIGSLQSKVQTETEILQSLLEKLNASTTADKQAAIQKIQESLDQSQAHTLSQIGSRGVASPSTVYGYIGVPTSNDVSTVFGYLNTKDTQLSTKIDNTKSTLDSDIETVDDKVDEITTTTIPGLNTELSTKIETVDDKVDAVTTTTIPGLNTELSTKIETVDDKVDEITTTTIPGLNTELSTKIETVDDKVNEMTTTTIPGLNTELSTKIDNARNNHAALEKVVEDLKLELQKQYKIIGNLTYALQDMEPACFSGAGYEAVAGFTLNSGHEFAPDHTFGRRRRGAGCPVYPPTARSSAGASGGGSLAIIAAVAAVVVIAIVVVVVVQRRKSSPRDVKGPKASEQHQISFENPLYNSEEAPGGGESHDGDGHDVSLYDDFDHDQAVGGADPYADPDGDDGDDLYDDFEEENFMENVENELQGDSGYLDVEGLDDGGYMDTAGEYDGVDAVAGEYDGVDAVDADDLYDDF